MSQDDLPPRDSAPEDPPEEQKPEPPVYQRGHSTKRGGMTFEVVERGPAVGTLMGRTDRASEGDDPDSELVARWQGGDERAFEVLIGRHQLRVFRLLLRMLGNREEAEDVSQEAFLSLHRKGKRFRGEARFSTFVYRVAVNAALNRRRTLGRTRDRINRLKVRQSAGDDLPHAPRNPEDATEGAETTALVQQAISRLPAALRFPIVLYDIEGLPYGEIARVLDIAEGTVKSRIHRGRQALRNELRPLVDRSNEGASL